MRTVFTVVPFILASVIQVWSETISVDTTSGHLSGTQAGGVASFKGIRFAQPPINQLRWQAPVPFHSSDGQIATSLGPSCVQQFPSELTVGLYNTPPPPEDEDCLFLNVWAPAPMSGPLKSVIVWFYGGGYTFGTASLPMYDGTSFAKNQDVILVSFNYRTNVFGFPMAQDLPASLQNLGFLDQELALAWVQDNIAQFGGDKSKVTIIGHSAGAEAVSLAITRRNSDVIPPFRAAIMLSGERVSTFPELSFSFFDAFATAMGCSQSPGPERLECLRKIPAFTIRNYTNGHPTDLFVAQVDNVTFFDDPLQSIRAGQTARVPIVIGSMEDDGTVFASFFPNISALYAYQFGALGASFRPPNLMTLYPGLTGTQLLSAVIRDVWSLCPAKLWSDAFVTSGIKGVYRYIYGATFADLEPFPNLGAYHGSELHIVLGTINNATATAEEANLSKSVQTALANFVKNPGGVSPAYNWPAYEADASTPTLAKIAYHGNVEPDNFVEPVDPSSMDGPCQVWDPFLDFRPR